MNEYEKVFKQIKEKTTEKKRLDALKKQVLDNLVEIRNHLIKENVDLNSLADAILLVEAKMKVECGDQASNVIVKPYVSNNFSTMGAEDMYLVDGKYRAYVYKNTQAGTVTVQIETMASR